MQTRKFGRTGHLSTVAIFGAAAFWEISQTDADKVMEQVAFSRGSKIAFTLNSKAKKDGLPESYTVSVMVDLFGNS